METTTTPITPPAAPKFTCRHVRVYYDPSNNDFYCEACGQSMGQHYYKLASAARAMANVRSLNCAEARQQLRNLQSVVPQDKKPEAAKAKA